MFIIHFRFISGKNIWFEKFEVLRFQKLEVSKCNVSELNWNSNKQEYSTVQPGQFQNVSSSRHSSGQTNFACPLIFKFPFWESGESHRMLFYELNNFRKKFREPGRSEDAGLRKCCSTFERINLPFPMSLSPDRNRNLLWRTKYHANGKSQEPFLFSYLHSHSRF